MRVTAGIVCVATHCNVDDMLCTGQMTVAVKPLLPVKTNYAFLFHASEHLDKMP